MVTIKELQYIVYLQAWIFEGNLRQNVLFGQPFDSERYYATVKACALEQDLAQLPFGDQIYLFI